MTADAHYVSPGQLCIGLFVQVDLPWMEHPFPFSRFKIRNQQQIDTLRGLGLERIRYEPSRSECAPLPEPADEMPPAVGDLAVVAAAPVDSAHAAAIAEKRARIEQLALIRAEIDEVERRFIKAADTLKTIGRSLHSRTEEAFEAADQLVSTLVATVLDRGDVKLHAVSQQLGEDVYFHSLNVAVLAMILGRAVHLRADELHQLGLGALFHDIGQLEIPDAILAKREPLSRAEQALLETHCRIGVRLGRKLGLSEAALAVIAQHHELADGSGYPERLQGQGISVFARIVAIANRYDNLCNPVDIAAAITPNEALSQMFARERSKYDDELLRRFVRCLGVYPPGSLVELSDQRIGLVLSVNPEQPLRPDVMVHDADVPKEAALIVRLAEHEGVKITRSLRAGLLPREVFHYLNPRRRVTYFCEGERERPR